jgi:hypothetical protein
MEDVDASDDLGNTESGLASGLGNTESGLASGLGIDWSTVEVAFSPITSYLARANHMSIREAWCTCD